MQLITMHLRLLLFYPALLILLNICTAPLETRAQIDVRLEVLGDLEGRKDLWENFLQNSSIVELDTPSGELYMRPEGRLVFLGDVTDRGSFSIEIMSRLLNLKRRYPNQVSLLVGNRDLNKLMVQQLFDGRSASSVSAKELKNLFEKLNAPEAFENRRSELQRILKKSVSDAQVVEDFSKDFKNEKSLFWSYLLATDLFYFESETRSLFVHGGLPEGGLPEINFIRNYPTQHRDQWLNGWVLDHNINYQDYLQRGLTNLLYRESVVEYAGNPNAFIYYRFSDETGNPSLSKSHQDFLDFFNINHLVVGHTPAGEIPAVYQANNRYLILADVSHRTETHSRSKITLTKKGFLIESSFRERKIIGSSQEMMSLELNSKDHFKIIGFEEMHKQPVYWRVFKKEGHPHRSLYWLDNTLATAPACIDLIRGLYR